MPVHILKTIRNTLLLAVTVLIITACNSYSYNPNGDWGNNGWHGGNVYNVHASSWNGSYNGFHGGGWGHEGGFNGGGFYHPGR